MVGVLDSTRTWGGGLILVSLILSMKWLAMVLGQSSRVERLRRLWCRGRKENLLLFDIDAATHRFSHRRLCPSVCMMLYSTRFVGSRFLLWLLGPHPTWCGEGFVWWCAYSTQLRREEEVCLLVALDPDVGRRGFDVFLWYTQRRHRTWCGEVIVVVCW